MQVVATMGKDQIWCYTDLELLKELLYFFSSIWEKAFLKSLRNYSGRFRSTEKALCAGHSFPLSSPTRAEDHPGYTTIAMGLQEPENCSPAPDFDVIGMGAETQN